MNKQQLASNIWALANELRGKVAAATYKDYMLGFLFYKYLSDKEENYLIQKLDYTKNDLNEVNEDDDQPKKNCMDNLGFFISYENLFSTWIDLEEDFSIGNVTVALSAFERLISPDYRKVFSNIFSTLSARITDLGSTDSERTKNAKAIIKLVKSIPTDNREDYDVLGFIYEFLLKNFAANAGKAGEFYTPHEASMIMAEIIAYNFRDKDTLSIYDPTSGSGSLLMNIGQAVSGNFGDKNKIKYYAQELIPETYNLTRMNLIMRDILPSNIVVRQGDTLEKDWPYFEEGDPDNTYEFLSVDACSSNPPYSQPWDPIDSPRFDDYGLAPKSKADYAFLLHNLYHLNPDGIMTIVLPHGVLFRGNEEGIIREALVRKHNIETIIGLPPNLFYGTGIPTIIMVLRKIREEDNILFIDASKEFTKEGNKNKLRQRDIRKIVDTVINRKTIAHYSRVVEFSELENNDFNLNIPRYVDSSSKEDVYDIYALMFGGIPNSEIQGEMFSKYWNVFPSLVGELYSPKDEEYSKTISSDIKRIIENNAEVKAFIQKHSERFSDFKRCLEERLLSVPHYPHPSSIERDIAEIIRSRLDKEDLIDYYDCFEILDTTWQVILPDLEIINEQGFGAAREIDEVRVLKKDSNTKKLVEKVVGNDGRLLPFEMIQKLYFPDKANDIRNVESDLSELTSEKDDLLGSIDDADRNELLKDDGSGDIVAKKLNKKISEIKAKIKKGAEYDEDSYESIIMQVDAVNKRIKAAKDSLKKKKNALTAETEEIIRSLSDSEVHDLLVYKWIVPICDGIDNLTRSMISDLEQMIIKLDKKYELTFTNVEKQIVETEETLSNQINDLDGNSYDISGLEQFKSLLMGEDK